MSCLHDAVGGAAKGSQVHAVLHVVLLQLGQDVFAVRVLPQRGDVRPDLITYEEITGISSQIWEKKFWGGEAAQM